MKRIIQQIILILAFFMPFSLQMKAAGETAENADSMAVSPGADSLQISLLTCSPGKLVYELYGHYAIRVHDITPGRSSDWVFNYGMFSFRQPRFIWRFMLGETDYMLGVYPYTLFYEEYTREGRGIEEQQLNLTPEEKQKLVDALSENVRPENATYRYNFFYDNCTTRALRMVEQAVDGTIVWPKADDGKTLRDIVHEFSAVSPWNKFGQDLLLGAEADRPADTHMQMFAPVYAHRFAEKAMIKGHDGSERHLVKSEFTLLPAQPVGLEGAFPVTPIWVFGILLALTFAITLAEERKGKYYWGFDVVLFLAQGLAGCIISFLFFFSHHPAVGSNWLVALFNPLPLIFFPWFMKAAVAHRKSWGMTVQTPMLAVALMAGCLGLQVYPVEVYLIIFTLLLRVFAHVRMVKAAQKQKKG